MKPITKKRLKAFMIDLAISGAVTAGVEYLLRKKIKNEAFHAIVTPTVVFYSLEYAQLRKSGQTYGYKKMGLTLEDQEGKELECKQLAKRMAYRDIWSSVDYIKSPKTFDEGEGEILPHDRYAGTIVKEI